MRSARAARYQRRSRRVAPADTYPPYMSLGGIGYKGMNLFFRKVEKFHGPIFTPPADTSNIQLLLFLANFAPVLSGILPRLSRTLL